MEPLKKPQTYPWWHRRPGWFLLLLLAALLATLFARSFLPQYVVFSNDGPLGAMSAQPQMKWSNFHGAWQDMNSIGGQGMSNSLSVHEALYLAMNSVVWAKFFAPLALLMLGLAAGFCFRRLGLSHLASVLGALAVMLNTGFFSAACWGVATQAICIACSFLAMGLLLREDEPFHWLRVVLAGLAVGMGVVEGYDIGALFSLCVALFVMFQPWLTPGTPGRRVALGLGRLVVIGGFAGLIAYQVVISLISTQIKGVAGTQQDARSKMERWDFATQWSLPKVETLNFAVPGLFGYRMDTPEGGVYWGAMGRDAAWDRFFANGAQGTPPNGIIRYSGGGTYTGVLVLLVAAWAVMQSFRKDKSVFAPAHRKAIWFWLGVGLVSLLLAFGRFAPFYQLVYALPYFSTIRNPAKFAYFVELASVILFAFGVHGLSRRYLETPLLAGGGMVSCLQAWWGRVRGFDRQWTRGCLGLGGLGAVAWMIYAAAREKLEAHLQTVQYDPETAKAIAGFSIGQAGWFLVFLLLAIGAVTLVVSGYFAGRRAKWAAFLLGGLLIVDLGRVNNRFIIFWDWPQKYATNEVLEFLRQEPTQWRTAILPFNLPPQFALLSQLYGIEWKQHHFLYYKIQTLDIVQMPRMPEDLVAFEGALGGAGTPGVLRRWELTSTRYLLGPAAFADGLNQQVDPQRRRFSNALRFNIVPKPGIDAPRKLEELTAVKADDGQYAVIQFAGALPRAGLYAQWIVQTNDAKALEAMVSPGFDPAQVVVVDANGPAAPGGATNLSAGTVTTVSYTPKDRVLKADVKTPAVLLLNDKYDPDWQVLVDGHAAPLLRCNFIMRGVALTPGAHTVEFHFTQRSQGLYVSLAGVVLALGLSGFLAFYSRKHPAAATG